MKPVLFNAWNKWAPAAIIATMLVLYSGIFFSDFLFLDEAYQLWNKDASVNFTMFAAQGRWLTGIFFEWVYGFTDTVADVKLLRYISLFGWMINCLAVYFLSRKWCAVLQLSEKLPFLFALFLACTPSVAIYIGWASCAEVWMGFLFALLAGHQCFLVLYRQDERISISGIHMFRIVFPGLLSLLFYQNTFGIALLPFMMWLLSANHKQVFRRIWIALFLHGTTYLIYFAVFRWYMKLLDLNEADRTRVIFQPLKKLAFFFSTPFSQAWNMNLLHNVHDIISQIIPFLVFAIWLTLFIIRFRKGEGFFPRLVLIVLILIASYAPSLVAAENFSSYRTMVAFNMLATAMLLICLFRSNGNEQKHGVGLLLLCIFWAIVGFRNFNLNFLRPLKTEFMAIKKVANELEPDQKIWLIRPPESLFKETHAVNSFKDEFGIPSTFKEWTPDPLLRQLMMENGRKRADVLKMQIQQVASVNELPNQRNDGKTIDLGSEIKAFADEP